MDLFKLLGTIAIDSSGAKKELDEVSNKGEKTQSKLSKAFSKIGKGAAVVGKAVGTGMVAAGTAMGTLTVKALNLSGELEQNMGGSEQVFKEYANKMQETAKSAFSNMGLSTSDFLATANKMGALFQGAGFSIKESSDLSASAMQRAADVASIMGIDTSAAMEAIAGAAKGNFTMMDNLGVAMNATTLDAYAMSKGIEKTTQEMTNQEKIGLAMEMFMEKTSYAAGNYARENETLAGSLGTAKAALTNFLDGSGDVEQLVTSFSNLANVVVKNLKEIAPRLVSGITDIVNQIMPMLPPLLRQLLPVIIEGAVSLINGLVAVMPTIVSAITSALPTFIDGFVQIVNGLVESLPWMIRVFLSGLIPMIPSLVRGLVSMISVLCTMLPEIIQPLIGYLPSIIGTLVDSLLANMPILIEGIIALIGGLIVVLPQILKSLWAAIKTIFYSLGTYMSEWFKPITDWFKSAWESLVDIVSGVWETIKNAISVAFKFIGSIISGAFQIITLPFRFLWENCKEYVFDAFEWIKEKINLGIEAIKKIVQPGFDFIKEKIITPIKNAVKDAKESFEKMKKNVTEKINALKEQVTSTFNIIKGKIMTPILRAKNEVIKTFAKIKAGIEKPINSAKETVKKGLDAIKGFFDNLKLKFPKIKMPHFSIKGKFKLDPPSVPSLSVDWYKKAMNNPMIMNDPTIFGYNPKSGSFMGGGEAGSEVVSGTNTLMGMIKNAVSGEMDIIAYYLQQLINMLADYFPQVLELQAAGHIVEMDGRRTAKILAKPMDEELGKIQKDKNRGK